MLRQLGNGQSFGFRGLLTGYNTSEGSLHFYIINDSMLYTPYKPGHCRERGLSNIQFSLL
jgi:hypothetical protein